MEAQASAKAALAQYSAAMFQHHASWPMQFDGGAKAGLLLLALYGYPTTTEVTCREVPSMYRDAYEAAIREQEKAEEEKRMRNDDKKAVALKDTR